MTEIEFQEMIQIIIERSENDMRIMTGLPSVDLNNEQLRFTRALEILEKIINLDMISTDKQKLDVSWIDDLGLPRNEIRDTLIGFWAKKKLSQKA